MADDLGAMTAIGAIGQGFLEGRRLRLQVDTQKALQQDQQNKYELAKKQEADQTAQNQYHLETERAGTTAEQGTEGWRYMDARKQQAIQQALQAKQLNYFNSAGSDGQADQQPPDQPPAPDISNAQGQGVISNPPGSGFAEIKSPPQPQGSPMSTVPSTNAQMNPSAQQPLPSFPSKAIRMFQMSQQAEKEKEVRGGIMDMAKVGGKAHAEYDQNGNPKFVLDDQGPQKNQDLINTKMNGRSAFGSVSDRFKSDPVVTTAAARQPFVDQAIKQYQGALTGNTTAQTSFIMSVAKAQGIQADTPEDILKSGSASQNLKNAVSAAINGKLDNVTLQNMFKDLHESFASNVESVYQQKPLYNKQAQSAKADGSLITATPALDRTFAKSKEIYDSIPENTLPSEQPGLFAAAKRGLLGLVGSKTTSTNSSAGQGGPMRAPPTKGDAVKGYIYMGGDPSAPSSWRKQ